MAATAWRLYSPSASGGKIYDLLLVDRYVLVGWGSMSGTMQYKIERFVHPEDARAWAVVQTETKERKGYQLDGTVHQSKPYASVDYVKVVSSRFGHRGASATFDRLFSDIYDGGVRLG